VSRLINPAEVQSSLEPCVTNFSEYFSRQIELQLITECRGIKIFPFLIEPSCWLAGGLADWAVE
jgi:hypothetical protein